MRLRGGIENSKFDFRSRFYEAIVPSSGGGEADDDDTIAIACMQSYFDEWRHGAAAEF